MPQRKSIQTMRIPKKIVCKNITYKVCSENMDDWGEIDYIKKTIRYKKNLSQRSKEHTLIHEILHGLRPEWTERRVNLLARDLYKCLKGNKII